MIPDEDHKLDYVVIKICRYFNCIIDGNVVIHLADINVKEDIKDLLTIL
jgi:hypothetical protein